ncbi:MAG: hypothetical protein J6E46_00565 [Faecalicoccus sp.]|nr:hypothetical protein [Faecalicoccus sp.]
MMNGKDKCKILKQIRKEIADANDIPYITENCKFQGNCRGTCPKCESELRYLETELENRRRKGVSVALAGMSLLTGVSMAGCRATGIDQDKDVPEEIMDLTGDEYIPDDVDLDQFELSGYVPKENG